MNRQPPPMYKKVLRKVPPVARPQPQPAASPQPAAPPALLSKKGPEPAAAVVEDVKPVKPKAKKASTKKVTAEKPPEKKAAPAKKPKKAVPAPKKTPEWSEDMSQRDLYKIAKGMGLKVLVRDSKAWILKQLKQSK